MSLKRFSLFYVAGYLVTTGLSLIAAPDLVFKLFFSTSNGAYGDVIPRMAGALILALGIMVINVIVRRVDAMMPALIIARVMLVTVWLALYAYTSDPFFLVVAGVVGFGLFLTVAGVLRERSSA